MPETLDQINAGEFRVYRHTAQDGKQTDLLSVTSVRNLCGIPYYLNSWQMANMADAALGTMKMTVVGPRGGVSEKRQVWEYPSEFAKMYQATGGEQSLVDKARKWLRERAEEPRNVAAMRGSIVHEAIEKNAAWDRIERPYVESAFAGLSAKDRKRMKRAITEEDINFVRHGVRQYEDMRANVPMLIIAREVRVCNITAGYAGTFDALVWLMGEFMKQEDGGWAFIPFEPTKLKAARDIKANEFTLDTIKAFGGTLVMADWKTSGDVYIEHVSQAHAYLGSEFAFIGGQRDKRITDLVLAADYGGLAHIRPNQWALHVFPWTEEIMRGFLGSVAFARMLAKYNRNLDPLWTTTLRGVSEETEEVL